MKKIIKEIKKRDLLIFFILVSLGIILRLIPHLPNFAPICALAIFAGVYLNKKMAVLVPFMAMIISDLFIGRYEFNLMISVYASFFVCVLIGFWLKNHKKWYLFLTGSVSASLIFFFSTNFAVWIFTPWYSKTIFGLIQCYLMALPFFRNALLGDLFYVFCFFGGYEAIKILARKKIASMDKIYGYIAGKSSLV